MPKRKPAFDLLLHYQTRLQGVANGLAQDLKNILSGADDATLQRLKSDWKDFSKGNPDARVLLDRANKLIKALEEDRAEAFDSAKRLTFETAQTVVTAAEYEASEEIKAAWKEAREQERRRRKIEIKSPSKKQLDAVLNYSPIEGETVAGWFQRWQSNDLKRIAQAVRQGAIDSLSVNEITRKILGTRENNFQDGIVQTTRTSAQTVARTIINGVSNVARFETMRLNSDALDGVQFLATLDARTSFICASLDGKIWKGEDIKNAARPPLHPNCRSTLIPYIELVDKEGNVIEDDVTRAAANADFDKLAKDAYNADAKQRGLSRRWDDLAPSTRKKYYYKAQRDWETRHDGQNAYRQVPSKTTFKEYFESQDDDFKRSWLGAGRYQLYRSGQATLDDLIKPAGTFRANVEDIFAPSIATREPTATGRETTNQTTVATDAQTNNQSLANDRSSQQTTVGTQQNTSTSASIASSIQTYKTPVESADDAVQRIDETRVKEVGLKRAAELEREASKYNDALNDYQDKYALYLEAKAIKDDAYKKFLDGSIKKEDFERILDDLAKTYGKTYKTIKSDSDKAEVAQKRSAKKRESERERNKELVELLFPDNGGKPFFDDKTINKIRDSFEKHKKGLGSIATEVLEMYNQIGRSVNTGKIQLQSFDADFAKFIDKAKDSRGMYIHDRKKAFININIKRNPAQVRVTFAHEIGHWIENNVPSQRANSNTDWLLTETKHPQISSVLTDPIMIDVKPGQHLCARPDGYSQKIYPGNTTELISTALEYVARDVEGFARRNPKHFDLLLENLKEFSK